MKIVCTLVFTLFIASSWQDAIQDEKKESSEKLVFKTEWTGERIELPPPFAPGMKLKGVEEIRFAPGMFDADSDWFFSYVFVFSVSEDQTLSHEVIEKETLAYYRGLAKSVSEGNGKEVDTNKFTLELNEEGEVTAAPSSVADEKKVTQYSGKLDWIEPFVTANPQVLHFEIQTWTDPDMKRNYLFVSTSPTKIGDESEIWKQLRQIRSDFKVEVKK